MFQFRSHIDLAHPRPNKIQYVVEELRSQQGRLTHQREFVVILDDADAFNKRLLQRTQKFAAQA